MRKVFNPCGEFIFSKEVPDSSLEILVKEVQFFKGDSSMKPFKKCSDHTELEYENLKDITIDKSGFSTTHLFVGQEVEIARFTLTKIINDHALYTLSPLNLIEPPNKVVIRTNLKENTKVFNQILGILPGGQISGFFMSDGGVYRVSIVAQTKEILRDLNNLFLESLGKSNFYRGKCLHFQGDALVFSEAPKVTFNQVVLDEADKSEFILNTVKFLSDSSFHKLFKKRAVLLEGPPGTGKTSLVSAAINTCSSLGISSVWLTGDCLNKGLAQVFDFCMKYLAPVLIVFEDIDMMGGDRKFVSSHGVVGELLSFLNGLEVLDKPLVIIGTTNRFDILDSAVTRPCRFDRRFKMGYPNRVQIEQLFQVIVGCSAPKEALDKEGEITGAHIQEIFNTARLLAGVVKEDYHKHLAEAVQIVFDSFYAIDPSKVQGLQSKEQEVKLLGQDGVRVTNRSDFKKNLFSFQSLTLEMTQEEVSIEDSLDEDAVVESAKEELKKTNREILPQEKMKCPWDDELKDLSD